MNAMNSAFILVPRLPGPKRRMWMMAVLCSLLMACTPALNWREVRNDDAGWKALFPAKPVEATRPLPMPNAKRPMALTLRSARIQNTLFAVGVVPEGSADVRSALEDAMLTNIRSQANDVQRRTLMINGHPAVELDAKGLMLIDPVKPAVPARLFMRSLVVPATAGLPRRVLEIIAVGPETELTEEQARQFIESLALLGQ